MGEFLEKALKSGIDVQIDPVYVRGQKLASQYQLDSERETSLNEILFGGGAFIELSGVHKDGLGDVANISFGLPNDRVKSYDSVAGSLVKLVAEQSGRFERVGPQQVSIYFETDLEPDVFLERLVEAPKEAYGEFTNFTRGIKIAQGMRGEDILDPIRGKGELFKDIFYGRQEELIPGFAEDGRLSMAWNLRRIAGNHLTGKAMNGELQTLEELAAHPVSDQYMSKGLRDKEKYFSEIGDKHRYKISVFYDESVDCCRFSSAAQFHKTAKFEEDSREIRASGMILLPALYGLVAETPSKKCGNCNEKISGGSESHSCKKSEKDQD